MIGWMIELLLNLPANNDGFLNLLVNILTGSMQSYTPIDNLRYILCVSIRNFSMAWLAGTLIIPDRESPTFTSLMWSIDPRKDLQEGTRNLPSLALNASKLAYENSAFSKTIVVNHWKVSPFPYGFIRVIYVWLDVSRSILVFNCLFESDTLFLKSTLFLGDHHEKYLYELCSYFILENV